MLSLGYPLILVSVPIILILWYVFFRERIGYTPANPIMQQHLKTPISWWGLWGIRLVLTTLIVSLVAGVTYTDRFVRSVGVKQDIMIVFDTSLSMLAEDMTPNRIEVAKNTMRNFVNGRADDRIGLIIFAGKPFVLSPFSTDIPGLLRIIRGVSPYLIRQDLDGLSGTNIGDALLLAQMQFSGSTSPSHSIILITDGKPNIGIDPLDSARTIAASGTRIFAVGLGSTGGLDLFYTDERGKKVYFYDRDGSVLKSDLDTTLLVDIANITGGKYFSAQSASELIGVFDTISKEMPKKTEQRVEFIHIHLTPLLIILVIILLFSERFYMKSLMRRYHLT